MPTEPLSMHEPGCHRPTDHSGACSPQRDDGLPLRPHAITDLVMKEQRERYAEELPCVGDTDGDGNCPLPGCMHCRPENFTTEQLQRAAETTYPFRVLMVVTSYEAVVRDGLRVASVNCPVVDDPRDETPFVRAEWVAFKDMASWMRHCEMLWGAALARMPVPGA